MPTIEQRTSRDGTVSYRVKVRLRGAPPEVATFRRKTDAQRWAQSVEAAIHEGRHFPHAAAKRRTITELFELFERYKRYEREVLPRKARDARNQRRQLVWFKDKARKRSLAELTPALVSELREALSAGGSWEGGARACRARTAEKGRKSKNSTGYLADAASTSRCRGYRTTFAAPFRFIVAPHQVIAATRDQHS
jgi:hypothetical protein